MSDVLIYCDDDPKGRVTKLVTFTNESGEWVESRAVKHTGELRPSVISDYAGSGPKVELRCKLCGASIRLRMETLAPILDRVAAGGLDRIRIGNLALVAARVAS